MEKSFEYLNYGSFNAFYNMALDEMLFQSVINNEREALIRTYCWSKPSISIGYFQALNNIDLEKCHTEGVDIVRRMTGGRAVFHHNELTYCIISQLSQKEAGQKKKVFADLSQIILKGIEAMGLSGRTNSDTEGDVKNPNCFQTKSICEIIDDAGQKLVGSAMLIKDNVVIQQGSIPLNSSYQAIANYLSDNTTEVPWQRDLDYSYIEQKSKDFIKGISSYFPLSEIELSETEKSKVEELINNRYNHRDWTLRK